MKTRVLVCLRSVVLPTLLASVLLAWGATPALAVRILMVGADPGPTFGGDAGTYATLVDQYGEAAELGDEGVFYMQASLSASADAALVDVVFLSSTPGSGDMRDKFEDAPIGVLNHEEALMDLLPGNFFMVTAATAELTDSQLTILEPDHPLAAELDGVVDVFTSPQIMSTGDALSELDLAPDAIVIAELTNIPMHQGIFAIEKGGELLGDGSPGSPAVAAGRRVMFFLQDQGGNFLTEEGEQLLFAALDWLAESPCETAVPTITRSFGASPHDPAAPLAVTLTVSGAASPVTIEETFPDHFEVMDAAGGAVDGTTITFDGASDGEITYTLQIPGGECAARLTRFSGETVEDLLCATLVGGADELECAVPVQPGPPVRILMIGANAAPTFGGDGGTFDLLGAYYGLAEELGDEGVFYMQASASATTDAELVDVVVISSTPGSGDMRDKFEDVPIGVLNHEEALMDNAIGNFFMVNAASTTPANESQLEIVDPDHPLAAGLDGTVEVFTSPQIMSTGDAFIETDLAPDVFVVAELTTDPTRKGIFAVEEGGELFGDGSPGSPDVAAGRRVNFFLQDQGGNFLSADGEALLIAAINWLADIEEVPTGPRFVRGGCNDDNLVDVSDALCALSGLFLGQAIPCRAALDVNGDGGADVTDPIALLSYLFLGGAQPVTPFPGCDFSPLVTDQVLGCDEPPAACQQ